MPVIAVPVCRDPAVQDVGLVFQRPFVLDDGTVWKALHGMLVGTFVRRS